MSTSRAPLSAIATTLLIGAASCAHAAEDFQIRYNLAGSLGGEVFAPANVSGLIGGIALTRVDVRKLTGNDGNTLTYTTPGGVVPLPEPVPSTFYPSYDANVLGVRGSGTLTQWNLGLAYITPETFGGGRIAVSLNLPYGVKKQRFRAEGSTPELRFNPAIPASDQAAVNAGFGAQYQGGLAALGNDASGEVSGIGDAEVHLGWRHATEQLRVSLGTSLVLPTGRYSASSGPDIGHGNFYTLQPTAQVVYLPRRDVALAGRVTVGLNTTNRDNDLRSGNWVSLETAAAYMTRLGPVGVHFIHGQQYQDDTNNMWGASRYRSTNAGLFFTTRIPGIDAVVTAQHMATLHSRNAKHGSFTQLRLTKTF